MMVIEYPVKMCSPVYKQIQCQHDNSTYFEELKTVEINELIDEYISDSEIW